MAIFVPTTNNTIVAVMKMVLNAAPGYTYLNQFQDYVSETSMEQYASALCNYADPTADNDAFAADIVANLGVPAAAVAEATTNIAALLDSYGANRGGAILRLLDIMAALQGDAVWGDTAEVFFTSVEQAYQYSANSANTTTSMATLIAAAQVDYDENGDPVVAGETYHLSAGADSVPGSAGNDTIIGTDATLDAADDVVGGGGTDELKISVNGGVHDFAAFEMSGVETVTVTADGNSTATFDMSGSENVALLRTLNSNGTVTFEEVTTLADLEVNNLTNDEDFIVWYQDTVVAGDTEVNLDLVDNENDNSDLDAALIRIGRESDANGGIETLNLDVSGATLTIVDQLDSDLEVLNITGDTNLTIRQDLNVTIDTVDAETFTGDLNIGLVGNTGSGAATLSVTTGTGDDTVDMAGVLRDTMVDMGDGDDTLTAGDGDDTIMMGAGDDTATLGMGDDVVDMGDDDDTLNIDATQLTVADNVTGGAGDDTINLTDADYIQHSETEDFTDIETWNLTTTATTLEVSNEMVTSITGANTLTVNMGVAGNTVDITDVNFTNTNMLAVNGTAGVDTIVGDDVVLNAKSTLAFGSTAGDQADVLEIHDGATLTADDQANITGLDVINLIADSSDAQVWNIDGLAASIDEGDGAAGLRADNLTINVDRDVQTGSKLYIDTTALGTATITVNSNSNMTVYVDNVEVAIGAAAVSGVTVQSSLEFTENQDNLTGTGTFTADSLDQLDLADNVNATGPGAADDTLRLDFAVNNIAADLDNLLNNFAEDADATQLEVLTFNTNNNVSFKNITSTNTLDSINTVNFGNGNNTVVDFTGAAATVTVNFGSGNDTVTASTTAGAYNMGNGTNTFTAAATTTETITSGTGVDTFNFTTGQLTAVDTITAGTGTDVLNLTSDTAATYALATAALTGIDTVNYTTAAVGDGLVVVTGDVDQTDGGSTLTVNINDVAAVNTVAIFNGSGVVTGNSLNVTMVTSATAGLGTDAADIIGGAGVDTLSLGTSLVTGYVIQGNAGADVINISGAGAGGAMVRYQSPNDGGNQGASTGYDTITGFVSGTDEVGFALAGFAAVDTVGTGVGNMVVTTDGAVNFTAVDNALVMSQAGTGLTDTDLLDLSAIAVNANVMGVTAAATQGGIIVAQGQTQSAIYLYVEQDGTANNVATSELKILGIVDTNALGAAATDLQLV